MGKYLSLQTEAMKTTAIRSPKNFKSTRSGHTFHIPPACLNIVLVINQAYPAIYPVSPSICLSVYLYIHPSIHQSIRPTSPSLPLSPSLSVSFSLSLSLSLSYTYIYTPTFTYMHVYTCRSEAPFQESNEASGPTYSLDLDIRRFWEPQVQRSEREELQRSVAGRKTSLESHSRTGSCALERALNVYSLLGS